MNEFTINLPVSYSAEDIEDAVWGNGSFSYPWWVEAEQGDRQIGWLIVGWIGWNPEEIEGTPRANPVSLTYSSWLNAAKAVADQYPWHAGHIVEKDIDADLGDMILQMAYYGEVVYG